MDISLVAQQEKRQLNVVVFLVFIGFVGIAMPYPILAPLILQPAEHGIIPISWSESYRGWIFGASLAIYPLGQSIGAPILGACSDQLGRKKILLATLLGTSLGFVLSGIALTYGSFSLLIISRFMTGLFEGNVAIARAIASDLKSIDKHKSFGIINSGTCVGYMVGPIIGGFLSDQSFMPWFNDALAFYVAALITAFAVILCVYYLEETHKESGVGMSRDYQVLSHFKFMRDYPDVKIPMLILAMFYFAVDLYYSFSSAFLAQHWSMSASQIALYVSVLSVGLTIGFGWLAYEASQLWSLRKVIGISLLWVSLLLFCLVLTTSPLLVMLWFFMIGLAIGVAGTHLVVALSDSVTPEVQGEAMGIHQSFRVLAEAFLCLIGGGLLACSTMAPLWFSAIIFLLTWIFHNHYNGARKS